MTDKQKNSYTGSDLACESTAAKTKATRTVTECGFSISEVTVEDDDGCPGGRYVTVTTGKIWLEPDERMDACTKVLASEIRHFIRSLVPDVPEDELCIMVAGLGNRHITADSLGPLTADKLTVTAHVTGNGGISDSLGCGRLCAVQPGVLGQTGIEAAEIIKGAARAAKAHVIIAVDALAARSTDRLAQTVQISDGGIRPGSGIGNRRMAVNRDTTGCPVIAVGIPTVVNSSTLVWDALEKAGITEVPASLEDVLENGRGFFVSPKESDIIADELSTLLARVMDAVCGL